MPTNSPAESALGATARNLEIGGKLSTHRAVAVSDLKRNGFIHRGKSLQINRKRKASDGLKSNSKINSRKERGCFLSYHGSYRGACLFAE